VNGYSTGYRWQCVEFVTRYYWQRYGRKIRGGNANDFYRNASAKGLAAHPNGGAVRPAVGDILVSEGNTHGHVGIIREVGSNYVVVVHQNFANGTADLQLRLPMTVGTRSLPPGHYGPPSPVYTVGGFTTTLPIRGWVRR
jgi:surface antigen